MSKTRIFTQRVTDCHECRCRIQTIFPGDSDFKPACTYDRKNYKKIKNTNKIASFCPLPVFKETENKAKTTPKTAIYGGDGDELD